MQLPNCNWLEEKIQDLEQAKRETTGRWNKINQNNILKNSDQRRVFRSQEETKTEKSSSSSKDGEEVGENSPSSSQASSRDGTPSSQNEQNVQSGFGDEYKDSKTWEGTTQGEPVSG